MPVDKLRRKKLSGLPSFFASNEISSKISLLGLFIPNPPSTSEYDFPVIDLMWAAGKKVGAAEVARPISFIRKFFLSSFLASLERNIFEIFFPCFFSNLTAVTVVLVP